MPDSGSAPNKTFTRSDGTRTGTDVCAQEAAIAFGVQAAQFDIMFNEIATALTSRWMVDGGTQPTADLPLNSFKFTGVGVGSARTHFPAISQIQDSTLTYIGDSSGTDTLTITLSPALTAYVAGQTYRFRAALTNSGAATLNLNSLGAKDIKKGPAGTTALAAGDLTTFGVYDVTYNGTAFHLLNPKFPDGFATTDSPQFTAINIGAASDTTLSRASAGYLQIEANIVYRAGGTDVAIADGGTGASTAANAFTALKQAASDTATGVLEIADQSEMETGTDTGRAVVPGRQHFHQSAAKAWACVGVSGGTPSIQLAYNVSGVTDTAQGRVLMTIGTDFGSASWGASVGGLTAQTYTYVNGESQAAGTIGISADQDGASFQDPQKWWMSGFGDFA